MQLKYIHFIVYACVFTMFGSVVTGVGPIILFYSQVTGQDETYYSYIFLSRAIGYLAGGSLVKVLSTRYQYHSILMWLIVICGISLVISSYSFEFFNQTLTMFVAAACCCMMNILCNLCIFKLFIGDRQDYWIQMINLFFGIGGLIGPVIVIFFHEMAMKVIGYICFFLIIPFFFLQSPENHAQVIQRHSNRKSFELRRLPQVCICLLFFFYTAQEVGYAGWIPTYAFKAGVADEKGSSVLASIFWVTNVVARLILLYWQGPVADRLRLLLRGLVVSTIIVLVFQWMGMLTLVVYSGVISSGIFLSAMFSFFFSVAIQYNFGLSPSITANFAMCASLGEGILVMPIGYAMGYFGYKSLIYIIFLLSAIMYIIFQFLITRLEEDSKEDSKDVNITLTSIKGQL